MSEVAKISWFQDKHSFAITICDDPINHAELEIWPTDEPALKPGFKPVIKTILPLWVLEAAAQALRDG